MDLRDKKELHKIDQTVGQNIKRFRIARNMSQQSLADQIGVTFQQVQKYENGANRVSASRLYALSVIFGLPVGVLFSDLEDTNGNPEETLLPFPTAILALKIEAIRENKVKKYLHELIDKWAI